MFHHSFVHCKGLSLTVCCNNLRCVSVAGDTANIMYCRLTLHTSVFFSIQCCNNILCVCGWLATLQVNTHTSVLLSMKG